jgi:hypothetical protein
VLNKWINFAGACGAFFIGAALSSSKRDELAGPRIRRLFRFRADALTVRAPARAVQPQHGFAIIANAPGGGLIHPCKAAEGKPGDPDEDDP